MAFCGEAGENRTREPIASLAIHHASCPIAGRLPHQLGIVCEPHASVRVNRRILIAEPDAQAAQSVASRLKAHSYEVETVGSTDQAILALQRFQPDVAMLDIERHELDGFDAARLLRHGRPGRQRVLLLALTGATDNAWRDAAHAAGFDVVVPKPVDTELLVALLEGLLQTQGADASRGDALDRVLDADH